IGSGQLVDTAQLRFKTYNRWMVNAEIGAKHRFIPRLGETRVFAEVTRGQNMDRGLRYDPKLVMPTIPADVVNGSVNDLDELAYWVRIEQDFGRKFTLA